MPLVKRDDSGAIVAFSQAQEEGWESVTSDDPQWLQFLSEAGPPARPLSATDVGFIRVLEDVVELLIEKGVIMFTELPASAQEKMSHRQLLRTELGNRLNLIGDD